VVIKGTLERNWLAPEGHAQRWPSVQPVKPQCSVIDAPAMSLAPPWSVKRKVGRRHLRGIWRFGDEFEGLF
jgi:hypothetical protein